MNSGEVQKLCPYCGLTVNNLDFHFGIHEDCGEMELKRKRGQGLVMNNLASTLKMTLPWSKIKESLTDGGEERRSKSKSHRDEKNKRRGADFGSELGGSFADFLKRDQEVEKKRERKKLEERSRKVAAIKARKAEELNSALSFIDEFIIPGSDLSGSDEIESKEGADELPAAKETDDEVSWVKRLFCEDVKEQEQTTRTSNSLVDISAASFSRREDNSGLQPSNLVESSVKMEAGTREDSYWGPCDSTSRVTQEMCSTSADTDVKPSLLKLEILPNVEKVNLTIQSGERKFKVKIEGQKRVAKLKAAVARQLGVRHQDLELRVSGRILEDSSRIRDLNLDGSNINAFVK